MQANQKQANPESISTDIESVSRLLNQSVDNLSELSLQSLYSNASGRTRSGKFLREKAVLLRGLVNEIDRPILKSFATDMINTMAGWFDDPEVLCCLINAIWTSFQATKTQTVGLKEKLTIGDTGFGSFLDMLIVFVDFIIAFITRDLKQIVLFIPDFIREIFGAVMGSILLLLQETLYTIRDSLLQSLLDWVDDSVDSDSLWAKCLPMQQFLNLIKTYISDYGLFAEVMEKIRGWLSGKKTDWSMKAEKLVPMTKDLEFLRWFRDLLVKLKRAVINFELCVEYAYVPNNTTTNGGSTEPSQITYRDVALNTSAVTTTNTLAKQRVPLIVGDDNKTITISDKDSRIRDDDILRTTNNTRTTNNGTYISRLSNDSIVNFVKNNYGFSSDVVEQSLKKVSDGCPGFPGGQELKSYLDRIRNRNTL